MITTMLKWSRSKKNFSSVFGFLIGAFPMHRTKLKFLKKFVQNERCWQFMSAAGRLNEL